MDEPYRKRPKDESEDEASSRGEESEPEDSKEEVEDGGPEDEDLEDNASFQDWAHDAREATEEIRTEKYQKYINEGMTEDQARDKAEMKTTWAVKKHFFDNYKDFLVNYVNLRDNDAHGDVVCEIEDKIKKGVQVHKAVSRAISKYQAQFDNLLQQEQEEEANEEDEEDQESEWNETKWNDLIITFFKFSQRIICLVFQKLYRQKKKNKDIKNNPFCLFIYCTSLIRQMTPASASRSIYAKCADGAAKVRDVR